MKVYNQEKTTILEEYDLEKGYLKEDILITHYDEVQAVEEQFHYETIAEYPNGGKDVRKVIDIEGVEYQPARDVEDNIFIYIPYTACELQKIENERRIEELRNYLNNVWSWQMERYNAEVHEIKLGIRKENNFTISLENLIISRKDAVDEINQLEEEIKEYEATLKTLC